MPKISSREKAREVQAGGAKEYLLEAIKLKKERALKDLDEQATRIQESSDPAVLYFSLFEIFKDETECKDVAMHVIKRMLPDKFFKEARFFNGPDSVSFCDEFLSVELLKNSQEVVVESRNLKEPFLSDKPENRHAKELAKALEIYLENKSFKNLKALSWYAGSDYGKGFIGKLLMYRDLRRKCDFQLLVKTRDIIEKEKERLESGKRRIEDYKKGLEERKDMAKSLDGLKILESAGWKINIKI